MSNVSVARQQELVAGLLDLIQQRVQTQQALEAGWAQQSEACKHAYTSRRETLLRQLTEQNGLATADYRERCDASLKQRDAEIAATEAELQEQLERAQHEKTVAHNDAEYDWFLAKQRTEKEYQADRQATQEAYQAAKQNLRRHADDFNEIARSIKTMLGQHQYKFKVQGGDLLEEPDNSDHLSAHLATTSQLQQLSLQFVKTFWVRFTRERYHLIVFLALLVALPYPFYLAIGSLVVTSLATVAIAVLAGFAAWSCGRSMARKNAHQFAPSFLSAATTGKHQLLSAQHQAKRRTQERLLRLEQQKIEQLQELDAQWLATQQNLLAAYTKREQELQSWSMARIDAATRQQTAAAATLDEQFGPQTKGFQQQRRDARQEIERQESEELLRLRAEYDDQFRQLSQRWNTGWNEALADAETMRHAAGQARTDFANISADAWAPTTKVAGSVQLGQLDINLADLSGVTAEDRRLQVDHQQLTLPVALDLIHAPSMLIQVEDGGRDRANQLLRLAMLRMLVSLPPGKLRFTIIDPVGLGQNFSAFMHLTDHDELLVNHRIWTETSHIYARLTDLTQHMENIIQTYLRNEFSTIQAYNKHAGEVAEPFHVLVASNFPAGFSEEAAQRLLSIAHSGPSCGVFTLLSVDAGYAMPRNFDASELKRHANVLVANAKSIRWADAPLNEFPLQLDPLPDEPTTTALLHTVGRQAEEGNRVEIPFSAVAPEVDKIWTEDSRAGIEVPIGRAGATKMLSMRLGRGTSQHVLVSGKTGSGKSTLMHAMITNLALRYSPRELQFYLIDFKKGVEFKAYAEHQLPHARIIAIESEREFGMSVLDRLDVELRRRGDLYRRVGVQGIAGYRDARPDESMPRIMLVIDEFQEFFVKEDKIAQDASLVLDRLVRQGRAFGIHVILGSQTLAGAYSLARATIGQMAVRIALQCSASDAHLILSDDNDAARLLRRPGEAIYNDANGLVEGNHPFQVVWLSDLEKENRLCALTERPRTVDELAPPIVFEGNVAADLAQNELLQRTWESPAAAEIPLAPRAWVGEAITIGEAPAAIFARRSGSNLMLVGQQEQAALGVMASSLLSLAGFSPSPSDGKETRFTVLDGTPPESHEAGFWQQLSETTDLPMAVVKPRGSVDAIGGFHEELLKRQSQADDAQRPAAFLFIHNLARFREMQKSDDDFGFGGFDKEKVASTAEQLANLLRDGPTHGMHTILWCDTYTNVMRWLDRQSLRDIESRVLFQMSAADSSNLMDSSAASNLGPHRAIFYSEDMGRASRFRPYGLPEDDFLLRIRALLAARVIGQGNAELM